jgi:hypothetical protein
MLMLSTSAGTREVARSSGEEKHSKVKILRVGLGLRRAQFLTSLRDSPRQFSSSSPFTASTMSSTKRAANRAAARTPVKKGRAMPSIMEKVEASHVLETNGPMDEAVAVHEDKVNLSSDQTSKPTSDHAQLFLKALFDGILPAVLDFPDITREQFEDLLRSSLRRMPPSQLKQSVLVERFQEHCDDMWRRCRVL